MNGKRWMTIAALGLATALSVPVVAQDRDYHDHGRYDQREHDRDRNRWDNTAHQFGYQDGIGDARYDRQNRHSFRPTFHDNYKRATRGYNSRLSGEQEYKDAYRQAYQQGYQRGYYGR